MKWPVFLAIIFLFGCSQATTVVVDESQGKPSSKILVRFNVSKCSPQDAKLLRAMRNKVFDAFQLNRRFTQIILEKKYNSMLHVPYKIAKKYAFVYFLACKDNGRLSYYFRQMFGKHYGDSCVGPVNCGVRIKRQLRIFNTHILKRKP